MMSKASYLTDSGDHNVPHLMFFQTDKNDAAWGAMALTTREMTESVSGEGKAT